MKHVIIKILLKLNSIELQITMTIIELCIFYEYTADLCTVFTISFTSYIEWYLFKKAYWYPNEIFIIFLPGKRYLPVFSIMYLPSLLSVISYDTFSRRLSDTQMIYSVLFLSEKCCFPVFSIIHLFPIIDSPNQFGIASLGNKS